MTRIPNYNITYLLRYWLGVMLIYHSYWFFFEAVNTIEFIDFIASHDLPFPKILAYAAKSIECFGGIMLLLGLFTRLLAFFIIIVLGMAVFYFHKGMIWGEGELAFNYLLIALILFFNPNIPFKLFTEIKNKSSK